MAAPTIWYDPGEGSYICTLAAELTADVATYAAANSGPKLGLGTQCLCLANGARYFYNGTAFVKCGA